LYRAPEAVPELDDFFTLIYGANHIIKLFELMNVSRYFLVILEASLKFQPLFHAIIHRKTVIKKFFIELLQSPFSKVH
jgi:hypothetical protein